MANDDGRQTWGIGGIGRHALSKFAKSSNFIYCSTKFPTLYMR